MFLCPVPVLSCIDNYIVLCLVSLLVFLMSLSPFPLLSPVNNFFFCLVPVFLMFLYPCSCFQCLSPVSVHVLLSLYLVSLLLTFI